MDKALKRYEHLSGETRKLIASSLKVISDALTSDPKAALSFNGGKDCTAVFHLTRLYALDVGVDLPKLVYFVKKDDFQEILDFLDQVQTEFEVEIERLDLNYKEGLRKLHDEGTTNVLMGQRRCDPHAKTISAFEPCDAGWPKVVRVNPILEWDFTNVWEFLIKNKLSYCKLYDEGYASLGDRSTTEKHPELVKRLKAGHELHSKKIDERAGRKT